MTAQSSEKLAQVLHAAGLFDLERRARRDEFHDFLSNHALPELVLDGELLALMKNASTNRERLAAEHIRMRLHDGEFDATKAESDEWAQSEDGQEAFRMLTRGD